VKFEHAVNEGDEFVVDRFFRGVIEVNGADIESFIEDFNFFSADNFLLYL